MHDLSTELRKYMDSFDTPFDPQTLIGKAEASESSSVDRPSVRRGVAVALAAASIVLAVAGLVLVGADLIGDGGAPAANLPPVVSTAPEATEVSSPGTSGSPSTMAPPEVSGSWTEYSTEHGLPPGGMSGVAVGSDGTVWAAQAGPEANVYRFDGTQWHPVGDPLDIPYWKWILPTPDGGVALGTGSQIMHFDGEGWLEPVGTGCDFAASVSTANGYRILGFADDSELVDIRFENGTFEVESADRGDMGGSRPSQISVWDTVDVDSAGNAWFGTIEGAWRFDGDALELFEFGVEGDCCAPLAIDAADNVWTIIQTHGDLFRLSPDGARTRYTAGDGIPFLYKDENPVILTTSDGSVWVLNRAGDAAHFDGVTWSAFTPQEAQSQSIPVFGLGGSYGVVDGPDGSTWTASFTNWTVGSDETLAIHRFFDGTWQAVPTSGIVWGSIGADYGRLGMAVAPDGSLWLPTFTGVASFHPASD